MKESLTLKKFQSQLSIILYNHILTKNSNDNLTALRRVGDIVSCIGDLAKCGKILASDLNTGFYISTYNSNTVVSIQIHAEEMYRHACLSVY